MGLHFTVQFIDPMKMSPAVRWYLFFFRFSLPGTEPRPGAHSALSCPALLHLEQLLRLFCSHPAGDFSLVFFLFFYLLAMQCGMWGLSPLTRDWTRALCIGSMESEPLDSQGSPGPVSQRWPSFPLRPVLSWTWCASSGRNLLLTPSGLLPACSSLCGCSPPSSGLPGGAHMPACEVTAAPGYFLVAYEVHSSNLFLRRIDYVRGE